MTANSVFTAIAGRLRREMSVKSTLSRKIWSMFNPWIQPDRGPHPRVRNGACGGVYSDAGVFRRSRQLRLSFSIPPACNVYSDIPSSVRDLRSCTRSTMIRLPLAQQQFVRSFPAPSPLSSPRAKNQLAIKLNSRQSSAGNRLDFPSSTL